MAVVLSWIWIRTWPVAGRAPAATACDVACDIEEEQGKDGGEVAGVGAELTTRYHSNLHFFPCHYLSSPLLTI